SPRFEERFEELNKIAKEVQDLLPILSLPDATKPVQLASGTLSTLTKQGRGGTYVILASTLRTDQEVILSLPVGGKQVRDLRTHELMRTRGNRVFLPFKSLDARVLVVSAR
ncbi:MAG: hypothetical protein HY318_12355, partial [Armatimonadetes bacterium]|nr:hypothetical protein [Armatimonadota bacterium]